MTEQANGTIPHDGGHIPKQSHQHAIDSEVVTQRLAELRERFDDCGDQSLPTLKRKLDEWAGDDPHSRYAVARVKERIDHEARDKVDDLAARLDDLGHTCAMVIRVFQGGYGATGLAFHEAAETLGYDSPEGRHKLGLRDVASAWEVFSLALANASERLRNAGRKTSFGPVDDFGDQDIPF